VRGRMQDRVRWYQRLSYTQIITMPSRYRKILEDET
jgi:hypothetical protein